MNKRVAIVIAVLIIVGGSAAAVSVFQLYGTEFHYEVRLANDSISYFLITLQNMADCNLTIGYIDDPLLTYSLDISLYESGSPDSAFVAKLRQWASYQYTLDLNKGVPDKRIKSVTLLLGSALNYTIHVTSSVNLNSTVIFSNNARLSGALPGFKYDATGTLRFGLDEDVRPDWLFYVTIASNVTTVYIDLPDGVDGEIAFSPLTDYLLVDVDGWTYRGDCTYSTAADVKPPVVRVGVSGSTAVVVLYD